MLKAPTCFLMDCVALKSVHLVKVPLETHATVAALTIAKIASSIGISTSGSGLKGPALNAMKSTKLLMAFVNRWK